jgi:hypothetical protein
VNLTFAVLVVGSLAVGEMAPPGDLTIRGSTIRLVERCALRVTQRDGNTVDMATDLPDVRQTTRCRFITHGDTNVVHLELVRGHYVVLIDGTDQLDPKDLRFGCKTRFKAVAVTREGKVKVSRFVNGGEACSPDRDRATFEYMSRDVVR